MFQLREDFNLRWCISDNVYDDKIRFWLGA